MRNQDFIIVITISVGVVVFCIILTVYFVNTIDHEKSLASVLSKP